MSSDSTKALAALTSTNHLTVCRALKSMAGSSNRDPKTIDAILLCVDSPVVAVERTALQTLVTLGTQTRTANALLTRLAARLDDAGCTYDCCGLEAFHGPISDYLAAILAVDGVDGPGDVTRLYGSTISELQHASLITQLLEDTL